MATIEFPWLWGRFCSVLAWLASALLLIGCRPAPEANVAGYLLSTWLGTQPPAVSTASPGALAGRVVDAQGEPIAGATVLVAQADGAPHQAITDADGRYRIVGIPPGQYVPAAVAPGYAERALAGLLDIPKLITIVADETTTAPPSTLAPYLRRPCPDGWPPPSICDRPASTPQPRAFRPKRSRT
ncbi:MAG: carboxypeptidase regulatory-like domain-containing protein [Anaerolineales bacterium]|nr:carboxypeptidase regulatory-like domain-containing protein [Anaerolineales bacterium]